jgi:hypothetical protein
MGAKVMKTPTIIELLKVICKTKFKSHLAPQCGATPPFFCLDQMQWVQNFAKM